MKSVATVDCTKKSFIIHCVCILHVCILEGTGKCVKELPFHYCSCRQLDIKDSKSMKGLLST